MTGGRAPDPPKTSSRGAAKMHKTPPADQLVSPLRFGEGSVPASHEHSGSALVVGARLDAPSRPQVAAVGAHGDAPWGEVGWVGRRPASALDADNPLRAVDRDLLAVFEHLCPDVRTHDARYAVLARDDGAVREH